jgi:hypothetical protein
MADRGAYLANAGLRDLCVSGGETGSANGWRKLMDVLAQGGIFIGAMAALALGSGSRWGFVLGLCVQPFWLYTSIRHRQWGIVAASVIYATGWALGVYRSFLL